MLWTAVGGCDGAGWRAREREAAEERGDRRDGWNGLRMVGRIVFT